MSSHVVALLLGLGSGAALALLAVGVVITHRASGVVNFAHAATGMWLAYVFYEFRETGDVLVPFPFETVFGAEVPETLTRISLVARPTVATAVVVTAVYAALFGLVQYLVVFRTLRHRPALARVVASIGLFLYLFACVPLMVDTPPATRPILPTGSVSVLGERLFVDRLVIAGIAVAVTAAVWAVSRFTRFGLATTAAAEDERGAIVTGLRPELLAAVNWMVATLLAGLAMVLVARVNSLDPLNLSLLIVPTLAAALLGGFRSFVWVAVAGFGVGMLQGWLVDLQSELASVSTLGLEQGLPFVLILVALVLRGRDLPIRGEIVDNRLPESPDPRRIPLWSAAGLVAGAIVMAVGTPDWRAAVITSGIAVVMSLSIVVLTGYVGQISLAPFAFAGVAAFSLVKLGDAGVPFPVAPVLAALVATALGVVVGIPAVRVRGMHLAIATLGAAVAIEQLLFKWEWFAGDGSVPDPQVGPIDLSIAAPGDAYPRSAFGMMVVVVTVAAAATVAHIRRSRAGLRGLAVRANERSAASSAVDVAGTKLAAFATSAFLAGLAGTLLAYQRTTVSPSGFGVFASLAAIAFTYLAGITSVSGAVIAGAIAPLGVGVLLAGGGELPVETSDYTFAIGGLLLVIAAVSLPGGITGALRSLARRATQARSAASFPAAVATSGASSTAQVAPSAGVGPLQRQESTSPTSTSVSRVASRRNSSA